MSLRWTTLTSTESWRLSPSLFICIMVPAMSVLIPQTVVIILQRCVSLFIQETFFKKSHLSKDWVSYTKERTLSSGGNPVLMANLEGKEPCVHLQMCHLTALQKDRHCDSGQNQNNAPEELPSIIVKILTLQWPFAGHSDGPADFKALGTFCWLAGQVHTAGPCQEQKREDRTNQATGLSYNPQNPQAAASYWVSPVSQSQRLC